MTYYMFYNDELLMATLLPYEKKNISFYLLFVFKEAESIINFGELAKSMKEKRGLWKKTMIYQITPLDIPVIKRKKYID